MNARDKILEIQILFEKLQQILEENRGENHVPGVRLAILELSRQEIAPEERISRVRSIFRNMMGGMGTLGDFSIWNENEAKRVFLNEELSKLLTELWNLLEC